jgi:response regulator of citrate/malate metabolism
VTGNDLTVLIVDDDFRVADMHAGIVEALPGFVVAGTANTLEAARAAAPVDLALVDVYLPDGSGIDLIRELRCDSIVLSADTEAATIRAAIAAGALNYLIKPFAPTDLAARLAGYARYRQILSSGSLGPAEVDAALDSLRPRLSTPRAPAVASSPTKQLVLQALQDANAPMSASEVAAAIGVSRATAQRYLAGLAAGNEVTVSLRYGTTGRPEQEFAATGLLSPDR